jgi:hypothetical protein
MKSFLPRANVGVFPAALVLLTIITVLEFPVHLAAQASGAEASEAQPRPEAQHDKPSNSRQRVPADAARELIQQVRESGRVLAIAQSPSQRLTPTAQTAPGVAPLLSFRSFDRDARYRLGRLDLVVDDAGH